MTINSKKWQRHGLITNFFHHSHFFFSFLKGTLEVAVAGEAGGVVGVEAVDGKAELGSAGAGTLFSTSADMAWSKPHYASGRSGVKQTAAQGQRGQPSRGLNTHTCFPCYLPGAEKVKWESECG